VEIMNIGSAGRHGSSLVQRLLVQRLLDVWPYDASGASAGAGQGCDRRGTGEGQQSAAGGPASPYCHHPVGSNQVCRLRHTWAIPGSQIMSVREPPPRDIFKLAMSEPGRGGKA
jgi:hypothetical protein